MCYELCGPPIDGTPEDMADYDMWLRDEGPYAPVLEDEEEKSTFIGEYEALERFDDSLNESWEPIFLLGTPHDVSKVLKEVDPVMYREEFNNWLDSEGLELSD